MGTSANALVCATSVAFTEDCLVASLENGRVLSMPMDWLPSLRDATSKQRDHWELIGGGIGIHWPNLDEDLSVQGLLDPDASG
ncbi:MAG: DUF2442 domain-containing protein [Oxalobacteraceae bacterium]|nr:MAG: DUF2442 domain-containing protein [Oxalobacteraceae bacterium]